MINRVTNIRNRIARGLLGGALAMFNLYKNGEEQASSATSHTRT